MNTSAPRHDEVQPPDINGNLTMPHTTLLDIPQEEQAQILAALRRARYGYLLAFHVLLLCVAGHAQRRPGALPGAASVTVAE